MVRRCPKILIIDNYDSFTYNLVQLLKKHGSCFHSVSRNNETDVFLAGSYNAFLFSPGPGVPSEVPVMKEIIRMYGSRKSILGVCLGHQAIAEFFGARLENLSTVNHGMRARVRVTCPDDYLFSGIGCEFDAGLYHSWAVTGNPEELLSANHLRVTATDSDGTIMAIAHETFDIRGVQFHPESFITECGYKIINNWIDHIKV